MLNLVVDCGMQTVTLSNPIYLVYNCNSVQQVAIQCFLEFLQTPQCTTAESSGTTEKAEGRGSDEPTSPVDPDLAQLLSSSKPGKIRRPPNAFMLYARDFRKKVSQDNPQETNKAISTLLGISWKNLPKQEKEKYFAKAVQLDRLHKQKYPGYVYNPKEARIKKQTRMRTRAAKRSLADLGRTPDSESGPSSTMIRMPSSRIGHCEVRSVDSTQEVENVASFADGDQNANVDSLPTEQECPETNPETVYRPPDISNHIYPILGSMDDPPIQFMPDQMERMRAIAETVSSRTGRNMDGDCAECNGIQHNCLPQPPNLICCPHPPVQVPPEQRTCINLLPGQRAGDGKVPVMPCGCVDPYGPTPAPLPPQSFCHNVLAGIDRNLGNPRCHPYVHAPHIHQPSPASYVPYAVFVQNSTGGDHRANYNATTAANEGAAFRSNPHPSGWRNTMDSNQIHFLPYAPGGYGGYGGYTRAVFPPHNPVCGAGPPVRYGVGGFQQSAGGLHRFERPTVPSSVHAAQREAHVVPNPVASERPTETSAEGSRNHDTFTVSSDSQESDDPEIHVDVCTEAECTTNSFHLKSESSDPAVALGDFHGNNDSVANCYEESGDTAANKM